MVMLKLATYSINGTIEVVSLFYELPVRRKLMRTENTKLDYINIVVQRATLLLFNIAINVTYNSKPMHHYLLVKKKNQHEHRLTSVFGLAFFQYEQNLSWPHGESSSPDWMEDLAGEQQLSSMQFYCVNGCIMRNYLINYAMQQVYQDHLQDNQKFDYAFYFEVYLYRVNTNIHLDKYEVCFYQARLMHYFIYQAVIRVLKPDGLVLLIRKATIKKTPTWKPRDGITSSSNYILQVIAYCEKESFLLLASPRERGLHLAYYLDCDHQKHEVESHRKILEEGKSQEKRFKQPLFSSNQTALTVNNSRSFTRMMVIYPEYYALICWQLRLTSINLLLIEHCLHLKQLHPLKKRNARSRSVISFN